jgi:hypothetical protein
MSTPTATPRTDDEETPLITNHRVSAETYKRMVDLARELETELAREKENRNLLIEKGAKLETELAAAKAECEELLSVNATGAERLRFVLEENTRLRALFPAILAALRNGGCCTTDVSVEFLECVPNEVASVVSRLRAEVERLTAKIGNQADRLHYLEGATNHATGTPLSQAIARAEKAEADTARLDWLWGNADDIYSHDGRVLVWLKSQEIRAAIDAAMKGTP